MAEQEVWIGSVGPMLYDDSDTYPDSVSFRGVRAPQFYAEDAPSSSNEILRYGDVYGSSSSSLKCGLTPEGGFYIILTNKTGSNSVKGTLVDPYGSSVDLGFNITTSGSGNCIGVIYDNAIADGSPCRVVVAGIAEVLLVDMTAATRGYWVSVGSVNGRADATSASPPATYTAYLAGIGKALETKAGGTNILCKTIFQPR